MITLKLNKYNNSLRYIRSFVRRERKLTIKQKYALDNYWPLIGVEFSEQQLNFVELFCRDAPVILEIGFGTGSSLVTMAKNMPDYNFLGIEVYMPGICSCLSFAYKQTVNNLRIIYFDAVEVLYKMIPDNSINIVQLFFPDPWHKTRHNKRRIVQPHFAKIIKNKLQIGGIFYMITDWKPYAHYVLQLMSSIDGYDNQFENKEYISHLLLYPATKFEQRSYKLGYRVWSLIFKKVQ